MGFGILSILFAILAISFLIFIHELGHYFMAKRVGMRVEVFSIGFGKPIVQWEKNGEKWQIGWLLFGGYVKIAGMDEEEGKDPYEIKDGFWGKSPWDRIKVAFMGPFVNFVFAFIIFGFLWMDGGREKNFAEFTHKIGWVDPQSELYAKDIRPGDELISYDGRPYTGAKDNLYAAMVADETLEVKGSRVNYHTGERTPFSIKVKPYSHPYSLDREIQTSGIIHSANYIVYDKLPDGSENPLFEGAPIEGSGIQYGDRIVWVDGEPIFSSQQLSYILNDGRAFLTIMRHGKKTFVRVPRVRVQELHLSADYREEVTDWQFEAGLSNEKLRNLYTIPYVLSSDASVEGPIRFIDEENQEEAFPKYPYSKLEEALMPGDQIIAVDGAPIHRAFEVISSIQENHINMIVERNPEGVQKISWREADQEFDKHFNVQALEKIANTIGSATPVTEVGHYALLKPIAPKMRKDFKLTPEKQAWVTADMAEKRRQIEAIEDGEVRNQALQLLDNQQKQLALGLPNVQDRRVDYNPGPIALFSNVFNEIWGTLSSLFTGAISPKWVTGPVGIVQVVQKSSMASLKEAFFWIGAISLNLGFLNLLPIPVLDGGTILINLYELVTRKRVPPKVIEKLIIPFAVLLITFFLFITYNDLSRLFGGFWR